MPAGVPGRRRARRASKALVLVASAVSALTLLPVVFVILQVRTTGWDEAVRLLWRPRVGDLLLNTAKLTVAVTVLCAVIGVGSAWLVCRTNVPWRRFWAALLVLPLAIPDFVSGYGWVSLEPGVQGYWGALLVTTLAYYPFVYLPVAATLTRLDPGLEEVGRSLGLGWWKVFWRLVLPQLRLAILGGSLVIALHVLSEYGVFAVLRFRTFATEIFVEYNLGFDGASAALLSLVLLVLCLVMLGGDLRLRGRASFASVSGAAPRGQPPIRLGRAAPFAFAGLAGIMGLSLGVPLYSLAYWLIEGGSTTLPPSSIFAATRTTLLLGLGAAAVTTAAVVPIALLAVRHRTRLATLVERGAFVARAFPGVVVAFAFVFFATRYAFSLYQSIYLLVAAYAILFLPLALVAVESSLAQSPPALEDVARSLGIRRLAVLWRVTLPLIAPGLLGAAGLVFLSTVNELPATLILRPTGTETLATRFWVYQTDLAYGAAAPYAAVMIGLSAIPAFLLSRYLSSGRRAPGK